MAAASTSPSAAGWPRCQYWLPPPQGPYRAVGQALEVIPRTLAQNCGANVIRTLTKLRAKHADPTGATFGIDGNAGARGGVARILMGAAVACFGYMLHASRNLLLRG